MKNSTATDTESAIWDRLLQPAGRELTVAAARALLAHTELDAAQVVRTALEIAADLCIYSNRNIEVEEL